MPNPIILEEAGAIYAAMDHLAQCIGYCTVSAFDMAEIESYINACRGRVNARTPQVIGATDYTTLLALVAKGEKLMAANTEYSEPAYLRR